MEIPLVLVRNVSSCETARVGEEEEAVFLSLEIGGDLCDDLQVIRRGSEIAVGQNREKRNPVVVSLKECRHWMISGVMRGLARYRRVG